MRIRFVEITIINGICLKNIKSAVSDKKNLFIIKSSGKRVRRICVSRGRITFDDLITVIKNKKKSVCNQRTPNN